ncbi:hypothetical protein [Agaribacterium haliotis]|uniref:hypothetical protein n=1 Tax=Agaribacterium haliotis TaxID=2013869 RepID=UPI000BB53DF8|nr:hypothetical protein [Agaribacterium haliotis]
MINHGAYTIEVHNNVIAVRLFAEWNVETSQSMCKEFLQHAQQISSAPWACLVDLRQWGLGGPEVWQPILEVNHWCAKSNQKMEAVVCSKIIQEYILRELQKALPDTESAFFDNEGDALLWLADHGYKF